VPQLGLGVLRRAVPRTSALSGPRFGLAGSGGKRLLAERRIQTYVKDFEATERILNERGARVAPVLGTLRATGRVRTQPSRCTDSTMLYLRLGSSCGNRSPTLPPERSRPIKFQSKTKTVP
jgi:hypothetical protein